jgi:membrane associated rhomboid family serine protease
LAGHQLSQAQQAIDGDRTRTHWFLQFLTGLPTEFNIAPRKTPVVTYSLILVNALIHFATPFAYLLGTTSAIFLALDSEQIGELHWVAALFTSQFLHVTTIHLLGNMYFLWILGDNIEDVLGGAAYLAFYIAAGVAAGIFYSVTVDPDASLVGASGAISGLLALYAVLFRRSKLTFMLIFWQFKLATPFYVGIWVAFNLAGWALEVPGIGWEAHIGGFAFGLTVGLAFHRRLLARRPLLRLLNDGSSHAA